MVSVVISLTYWNKFRARCPSGSLVARQKMSDI